jgi:3-hydroxyisobutyrate dehydrogenase-like beta-hydroxyacid dehydrogenase
MAALGWIGMGRIGSRMASLLLGAGHRLVVHDLDFDRLAPALDAGARAADCPAAVAADAEAVFLSVTDTDAVESIAFGPRGLAEAIGGDGLVIDHTTIHPGRSRDIAARLGGRTGAGWVDAPVSGSPGRTLAVFLGGAAADVERVRPWIAAYARTVTHVGPAGMGQLAKSCNQAIVCATLAAWSEVLDYAQAQGLDPAILMAAIGGGGADSSVRRHFLDDLLARRLPPETVRNMLKDLEIVRDTARGAGLALPLNEAVGAQYRRAFSRS